MNFLSIGVFMSYRTTFENWSETGLADREFHYYKDFYKFFIILSKLESGEKIFAILGETSIKDNIFRIDI